MQQHETKQVLESLQSFAALLEKDGLYSDAHQQAFERTALLLTREGLKETPVDLMPISQAAAYYLERVFSAVSKAEAYQSRPIEQARLCVEMSDVYYLLGDWDAALNRLADGLKLLEVKADNSLLADTLMRIGRVQSRRSVWDEATDALDRAVKLYRRLKNKEGEGRTLLMIANAHFLRGRYKESESHLQTALATEGLPGELTGDIHLTWGVLDMVGGRVQEAESHYREAIDRFMPVNDHRRLSQVYFNMGIMQADQENWRQAGHFYEKSLIYAQETGDLSMVGILYLRRGEMQVKLMEPRPAMRYARRARDIFERLSMTSGKADVYRLIGEIAAMTGAEADAHLMLAESRRLQQAAESPLGEAEVAETEAAVYEQEDKTHDAGALYQYALATASRIGAEGAHVRRIQDAVDRLTQAMDK